MSMSNDLLFYFNNNLFMSSNLFDSMQGSTYVKTRPFMGGSTYDEPYSDKDFRRIRKYNKISKQLQQLTSEQRRKLTALFDFQYRYPMELRVAFGKHAGLSLWHATTMQELLKLCQNKARVNVVSAQLEAEYAILEYYWKETK